MNRPWILVAAVAMLCLGVPERVAADEIPVAYFEVRPTEPQLNQTVYFNSTSFDEEGPISNWTWDFGDGHGSYGVSVTHVFTQPGSYVVQLTVRDSADQLATRGAQLDFASPTELPRALDSYFPSWLFWVMPFLVSLLLFTIGYLVVAKGQPAIYNLVFFLFFTASGLKSLTEALAVLSSSTDAGFTGVALIANRVVSYLLAPLFLWFVLVFPRPIHRGLVDGRRGAFCLLLSIPFLASEFGFGLVDPLRTNVFNVLVSLVALGCTGLLVYHAWETDSEEERKRIRLLAVSFALIVLAAGVVAGLGLARTYYENAGSTASATLMLDATAVFGLIIAPGLEVVAATILMYAILRYQLLGISKLLVRATRGTLTAILVPSVFVVCSNSIEQLFQVSVLEGVRYDYLIAGFISTLLMFPVQKWATFILYRLFPGLGATGLEEEARRRVEIYEAQLRYNLLDGDLNPKEVRLLKRLADSISLKPEELDVVVGRFPGARLEALRLAARPAAATA